LTSARRKKNEKNQILTSLEHGLVGLSLLLQPALPQLRLRAGQILSTVMKKNI